MKWITKHHVVSANTLEELSKRMDTITMDRFIIASNVFPVGEHWEALLFEKAKVE